MTEGAKYYGVKQEHIDWLNNLEQQRRAKPENFAAYDLPEDAPTMTLDEVKSGTGKDGGPIYCTINNKVLEFNSEITDEKIKSFVIDLNAGKQLDVVMSNLLYDPKYGIHQTVETMSEEHRAYLEDLLFTRDV